MASTLALGSGCTSRIPDGVGSLESLWAEALRSKSAWM